SLSSTLYRPGCAATRAWPCRHTALLVADVLFPVGEGPRPRTPGPRGPERRAQHAHGRGSAGRGLLVADVLFPADLRRPEPQPLQCLEAGVDHVRIAAQVGDVACRIRREPGKLLLHVAMAHVGMRMRRTRLRQLADR